MSVLSNNKTRWTREEELNLVRNIAGGGTLDIIALNNNRSLSAVELRLKKIICENVESGKSISDISKLLNMPEEKVRQYFYSYKDFKEKHSGIIGGSNPPNQSNISVNSIASIEKSLNLQQGGKSSKINKIEKKLKKIELENKILRLIVDNKDLTHKLNKLIKEGKVDKSIKELIKKIRRDN